MLSRTFLKFFFLIVTAYFICNLLFAILLLYFILYVYFFLYCTRNSYLLFFVLRCVFSLYFCFVLLAFQILLLCMFAPFLFVCFRLAYCLLAFSVAAVHFVVVVFVASLTHDNLFSQVIFGGVSGLMAVVVNEMMSGGGRGARRKKRAGSEPRDFAEIEDFPGVDDKEFVNICTQQKLKLFDHHIIIQQFNANFQHAFSHSCTYRCLHWCIMRSQPAGVYPLMQPASQTELREGGGNCTRRLHRPQMTRT